MDTEDGNYPKNGSTTNGLTAKSGKKSDQMDTEGDTQKAKTNYFKLYQYADTLDVFLMILGTLGAIVNGLTLPAFTVLFGDLVNKLGDRDEEDLTDEVNRIAIYFVVLGAIAWIASYFEVGFWMWTGSRQAATIREKYLRAVLNQDITYFDKDQTSGALLQGLNDDTLTVQQAVGEKVGNTIHHLATFIGGIVISLIRGWQLALVIMSLLPLIAICGAVVAQVVGMAQTQLTSAYGNANSLVQASIGNVRTVVSFNAEEKTQTQYNSLLHKPMQLGVRVSIFSGVAIGTINVVIFGAYGLALWYGNELVIKEDYQGGDVLNVIFASIIGGFSLGQAAPNLQFFIKGTVGGSRLFSIIRRKPEIVELPDAQQLPSLRGEIELRNVKFTYPARPDVVIFRNLSSVIPSGKTVALVGQSGSGKSTVVQLIERFYDPQQGTVFLDGIDIRSLSLNWYRDQIGLVSQEPTLFATTIRQNIMYGCEHATEEQMIQAAKAANAYRFISHLPHKFDTNVGERGVQLSGGQKQRIAIARAILKNPQIMLLDEATSALDTQSERIVQQALDNMIVGRTTVVIAHRLSTIRNADIIAVVQDGEIVEQGSHDDLINKDAGAYQTLVKLQQQHASEEPQLSPSGDIDEVLIEAEEPSSVGKRIGDSIMNLFGRGSLDQDRPSQRDSKNVIEMKSLPESQRLTGKGEEEKEGEKNKEKKSKVSMTRLWKYNESEWAYALFGSLSSVGLGAAMPLFAIALTDMVDVFFMDNPSEQRTEARKWALIFFAIGAGWLIFSIIQQLCFGKMGQVLARRLRTLLFSSILSQEIGWFDQDENSSGNISSRLSTDTLYVRGAVGDALGLLVQNFVTVVAGFVIAYVTYWKMALVITAVFPLLAVSSYIQTSFLMGFSSQADKLLAGANQVASESISSVRIVQAYNMQTQVVSLYRAIMKTPLKTLAKQAHVTGCMFGISFLIIFCTYGLAFWYGGQEVDDGNINVSEMLRVFFAILLGAMGAANAQMQFPDIGKAGAAVERVFSVLDRKPLIQDREDAEEGATVEGTIQLRDVEFAYPARPTVKVFKSFNLLVPSGQTVALVGESGSGKSTIVGLIERFYEPLSGTITLDNVDIRTLKLKWLRSQIGLVSQEPILFSMSIEENIKYGCENASAEQVKEAAKIANAAEFIEKLPEQYQTEVGEQGIQLSGGQKQRVAIARAVIKNPRILLLDEATSALDAESEKIVQNALDFIMEGRTTIVIAHRLSTIRNANKIAVVNKGNIAEQGTHEQLMTLPNGLYQQMVRAQNQPK